ncbi:MAG TPA: alpha-glucuronidase family glycosyl hydrolase [Terracidiphilus sp.]|nr:alpha-glucuronidase family glycosyl hydrolase [Terracidiphilus sp.]
MQRTLILFFAALFMFVDVGHAQTSDEAWLSYRTVRNPPSVPIQVRRLGKGQIEQNAVAELQKGIKGLFGFTGPAIGPDAIVLATTRELRSLSNSTIPVPAGLGPEDFRVYWYQAPGRDREMYIVGGSGRGVLYGAFDLLRNLAQGANFRDVALQEHPAMPIRWVDDWDNLDGSIERGYAGRSIFFENGHVRKDLAPVAAYARLLASVGINGCNVNNVNADPRLLELDQLKGLARIADTMRPWGVRLALSVDIASPQKIGGLATYDPLDPKVQAWWRNKINEIYSLIPDFAGFTVKADSEGQPGPASYGRTPADAANTLAGALNPHGGVVLYRAFVYNHHLDWHDPKADRARAAYDIFHPLDGKFAPNVIIQTKEGPIDFQAQEPVSPLFGGLTKTNQALEVEVTQEYTGQQRHLVYLAPMWKWVLDFDMRVDGKSTPVKDIVSGKSFGRPLGGMVAVAGVGRNNWLNSPLAMANLYAFGRFAWNPNLSAKQIAEEWTRQSISNDPVVVQTVTKMLMQSWPAYVNYTGPLGMQTLTDITGSHYGPNIESSERNGWGQWHKADHEGVGFDRTVATGTGFVGQYWPEVAKMYESAATTPDNLLLFFHHEPYTYRLHDGKTIIQYIYDSHYQGAQQAANLVTEWNSLRGRVPAALFNDVQARLEYQAGHAIVWRDAIVQYFHKLSGISDDKGRAGHFPGRLEAEGARLTGYKVIDITPWEDASRGKAVSCQNLAAPAGSGRDFSRAETAHKSEGTSAPDEQPCTAEWIYNGPAGRFSIAVQYFDLQGGVAHFTLSVNNHAVANWAANADLPSNRPDGDNSTRFTARDVNLKPGDKLRVEGTPNGADPADLDYIEVDEPDGNPVTFNK